MRKKVMIWSFFLILGLVILVGCAANKQSSAPDGFKTAQQSAPTGSTNEGGASVIVQSDNAVTDADKQQALNDLQSEVDSLVNSLNNMDDASDSELTFK